MDMLHVGLHCSMPPSASPQSRRPRRKPRRRDGSAAREDETRGGDFMAISWGFHGDFMGISWQLHRDLLGFHGFSLIMVMFHGIFEFLFGD